MADTTQLVLRGVSKSFAQVDNELVINAVTDINLQMREGEFVSIVGKSGCGKSTILRMIAGLTMPTSGTVTVNGKPVKKPGPEIGMVFQKPTLFPWLTVEDNVAFSCRMQGSVKEHKDEINRMLSLVGLEEFRKNYPLQLSGGMAQRAALARALISRPRIMLMDEPLSALDAFTRMNMQNEILDMWRAGHQLIVMVTHDISEAVYMSSRVLVMDSSPGRILDDISVEMPHPRDRSSPEFSKYYRRIFDLLQGGAGM